MARIPRGLTVKAGFCAHKGWHSHNKEDNLGTATQKERYLHFLNEDLESEKYENGSVLEAVTIMSNHTHELSYITDQIFFSKHMQRVHARYGRYFNDANDRCGKVAKDRPYTTLIGDDTHRMRCVFYINANAHRANLQDPDRYEYSTHKLYAYGKKSPWMRNIKLPDWYLNLGNTPAKRERKYRRLFEQYLKEYGQFKFTFSKKRFFGPQLWVLKMKN